jgi:hypothetical protein
VRLLDVLKEEKVSLASGEDSPMAWKTVLDLLGQLHEDGVVFEASFELVQEILIIGLMEGNTHVEIGATARLGDMPENLTRELEWRTR